MKLESVVGRGYTEKHIALLTRIRTLDDLSKMIKAEREQACRDIDAVIIKQVPVHEIGDARFDKVREKVKR